jgi:hypothetical protein
MMTMLTTAIAIVVTLGTTPFVPGQQRTSTEPDTLGLVAGRVVDSTTGDPIGAAVVALYVDGGAVLQAKVQTLADGRFLIPGVPQGAYQLFADKPGYLAGAFGRIAPDGVTLPLEVGAGEWVVGRTLVMWKYAALSGTVLDDAGLPITGAAVRAIQVRSNFANPDRVTYAAWPSTATTDDRGVFRFVVPPGRYTALVLSPYSPELEGQPGTTPTFYPGAEAPSSATFYDIGPGEVRDNVDLRLTVGTTGRVTGRVVSPDPLPKGTQARLLSAFVDEVAQEAVAEVARSPIAPDGSFAFAAVPHGPYVIRLATPTNGPAAWANHRVQVSGALTETAVPVDTGRIVSGVVRFLGDTPPSSAEIAALTVTLDTIEGPQRVFLGARAGTDNTFAAGPFPSGTYVVSARSPGWTMISARSQGREVALAPFDLDAEDLREVEVTFARTRVNVVGHVTIVDQDARDRALVVLFPVFHRAMPGAGINSRRRQSARVDDRGEYRFSDVPPGDYHLAVIDGSASDEWRLPDWLDRIATTATKVSVTESGVVRTDLRWSGR